MRNFPGYRHFIINPQVPEGVTWANASKETPYGTVSVKWKIEENLFGMDLKIPVGSTASVIVPKDCEKYTINGKSHKVSESFVVIESGQYRFTWASPTR